MGDFEMASMWGNMGLKDDNKSVGRSTSSSAEPTGSQERLAIH